MLDAQKQRELLNNLPAEIRNSKRFFPVSEKKLPKISGWQKPENQRLLSEIEGSLVGFDVIGHGVADDYMFLDFDHVLEAETGEFVSKSASDWYDKILAEFPAIYREKSISGTGLHMFLLPTAGKFPAISASSNRGTLWFDRDKNIKLEVFYKTGGRYCLVTGDKYKPRDHEWETFIGYSAEGKAQYRFNFEIPFAEKADAFISELLPLINVTECNLFDAPEETPITYEPKPNSADKALEIARALAMLEKIPVAQLTRQDWLNIGMALKNNGNSVSDWEIWSRDDTRYKAGECEYLWEGFKGGGLTIATIHELAQKYGYAEKQFLREWYKDNPALEEGKIFEGDTSDYDNARRIIALFGGQLRYVQDVDNFATYECGLWRLAQDKCIVYPLATEVVKQLEPEQKKAAAKVAKLQAENSPEEELKAARKIARQRKRVVECFKSRQGVSGAVEMIKGVREVIITTADLDQHKNLLNCKNCVVDLETGKEYQPSPELLMTQQCRGIYRPKYYNETVNNFLQSILPEADTRAALMRYLGYGFTGECRAEKFLFMDGAGGNGKGTLTKTILHLAGDYGCAFPVEAILYHKGTDPNAATASLNVLEHRRLAISEEIPQGGKMDAAKLKQLTGGDRLYIRRLHHEASSIDPTHTMIFSGNHLPEIGNAKDPGIIRRLLRIKFEQDFTQAPDETLKGRLLTAEAQSGLLTLIVENAQLWYKAGLIVSSEMKEAAAEYIDSQDFIGTFLAEYCEKDAEASVSRKSLLEKLREEYPRETNRFSDRALVEMIQRQASVSYRQGGKNHTNYFYGIKINTSN